jgi:hypothetical protein
MIKFFRKIRQQLLTQNKFSKYLLYAIGEIVLVVIGILIALSINNWNENRKSEERMKLLLINVQEELLLNIKSANKIIDFYREIDSLIYKVVTKTATFNNYKSNLRYSSLLGQEPKQHIIDDAFKTFIASQDKLPVKEDSTVIKLKKLYGVDKPIVDEYQRITSEFLYNFLIKLKTEKKWFSAFVYSNVNEPNDELSDYFLNDQFYLNDVIAFEIFGLQNHFPHMVYFRNRAIFNYENISESLNLEKDSLLKKNYKDYQHYIGKYKSESLNTLEIKEYNNELVIYQLNQDNESIIDKSPLFPDSKKHFTYWNLFGQLTFDESNEVTGLILSNGATRLEYVK